MRRALWAAAVGVVVVGCGPGISPDFSGRWMGATVAVAEGTLESYTASRHLSLEADGYSLDVSGVCPDGAGAMRMDGSEDSAEWTGRLKCPAVSFGSCPAVVVTLTSGTAELRRGGWLRVQARGTSHGCGEVRPVLVQFLGKPYVPLPST